MKTVEKQTKKGVKYLAEFVESVDEAVFLIGTEGVLQAINYVLGVRAAKKATAEPPLPKELLKLLRKDKELRKMVMEELQKKKKSVITVNIEGRQVPVRE